MKEATPDDPRKRPTHSFTVEQVLEMSESKWLEMVSALAFPQRAKTMVRAMELAKERGVKNIVETGCIRGWAGDGQSTLILAMLAIRLSGFFRTFDISDVHVGHAMQWIGISLTDRVSWNVLDSVSGLSLLREPVQFVYLDSYDYDASNPRPCQLHALAEVGAIYGKLSDKAIIVMDDANLQGGGKVAMAVDFLKGRGWKELASDYQVIMSR